MSEFDTGEVDPQACVDNAQRFDSSVFRETFPREVETALRDGPAERLEYWPRIPRRAGLARRPARRSGRSGPA